VIERTPEELATEEIDVVVAQRQREVEELIPAWTRRRPGADLPCVYVEHNTPDGLPYGSRHPMAERSDIVIAHVTHFNNLFWDNGRAPTVVIEHGVVDPGNRFTGELPRAVAVINDAPRRGRATGTDILLLARSHIRVDLFGMRSEALGGSDVTQAELHSAMARRRVYFHPFRWTSLGLSLIEAMHLGMPVVATAATEASEAVPSEAGIVSNRLETLTTGLRRLASDLDEARHRGRCARQAALGRYGLGRFLDDWDRLLKEVVA
jgi:hypothetical protein